MTDLEKKISDLETKVKQLIDIIAPPMDKVTINNLVRTLGPDEAAREINRRNKLRGTL